MKKLALVFAAVLGLSAAPAHAATVTCPDPVLQDPRDFFVAMTTPAGITASCWDYGGIGQGNPEPNVVNGSVVLDDLTVQLPTGISTTPKQIDSGPGGAFSGFNSGGTSGQVNFLVNASSALYLLFKFGGGQTDPYFFVFKLTGVNSGESVSWLLNQTIANDPLNGLSGIRLYGNTTTSNDCTAPDGCNPGDVPEPTSIALLGLGMLGAGLARRRRSI